MLRTLALGGCMGEVTPRGLLALAPLQRLVTLALVHVHGFRGLARVSRMSTVPGPPGEDTIPCNQATLVRFLDRHPVLQDWYVRRPLRSNAVLFCAIVARTRTMVLPSGSCTRGIGAATVSSLCAGLLATCWWSIKVVGLARRSWRRS